MEVHSTGFEHLIGKRENEVLRLDASKRASEHLEEEETATF